METTHVRRFAKLDNLVQVGHAADVGEGALMVAYSGVAGSGRLGAGVVLAAKAAVLEHLDVGDGVKWVCQCGHPEPEAVQKLPVYLPSPSPMASIRPWVCCVTRFGQAGPRFGKDWLPEKES